MRSIKRQKVLYFVPEVHLPADHIRKLAVKIGNFTKLTMNKQQYKSTVPELYVQSFLNFCVKKYIIFFVKVLHWLCDALWSTPTFLICWMETNRGHPLFSLPAIQGFGKVVSFVKCTTMAMKMCGKDLFLSMSTFKYGRILFYKALPVFWTIICTRSKTPTTWSKKPVLLACFFFSFL